jgi:hypothetical protein
MRTKIRLDEQLLRRAKAYAARNGRTLISVLEDALRELLARGQKGRVREVVRLPTYAGKGLQPGVDLDDTGALTELMDRPNAVG